VSEHGLTFAVGDVAVGVDATLELLKQAGRMLPQNRKSAKTPLLKRVGDLV